MKARNVIGIVVLVVTLGFAIQIAQQNRADARQVAGARAAVVQYATLEFSGEDKVTWRTGGNQVVRTESVQRTIQRLGGTGNYALVDLLNQIGRNGWTLRQKDGDIWIFSR